MQNPFQICEEREQEKISFNEEGDRIREEEESRRREEAEERITRRLLTVVKSH